MKVKAQSNKFKVGDYVFAKMRGYEPWPEKIVKVQKNNCKVFFFGEHRKGSVSAKNVFSYDAITSRKYCTLSAMKSKLCEEAATEMEDEIRNKDVPQGFVDELYVMYENLLLAVLPAPYKIVSLTKKDNKEKFEVVLQVEQVDQGIFSRQEVPVIMGSESFDIMRAKYGFNSADAPTELKNGLMSYSVNIESIP